MRFSRKVKQMSDGSIVVKCERRTIFVKGDMSIDWVSYDAPLLSGVSGVKLEGRDYERMNRPKFIEVTIDGVNYIPKDTA